MSILGLSFGKSKQKSTSNTTVDKTTATNQSQAQQSAQSTSGSQNTSQTGSTANQGTSSTSQNQSGTQASNQTTAQSQTTSQFSDPILSSLESGVSSLLGSTMDPGSPGRSTANSGLKQLGSFDAESYINGIVGAATARSQTDRESQINTAQNAAGGTISSNSAAALLANRINNDADASLAGVKSNATESAQKILAQNVQSGQQQQQLDEGFLGNLLQSLKGGVATTTGVGTTGTVSTSNQTGGSTTATSENGTTAQNQQQTSQQDVLSQILSALSGTEHTTGTENNKSTGTKGGFGASLSI